MYATRLLLLGFLDAPDESSARVRAWHLWDGLEPVRLCVEMSFNGGR